MWFFSSKISPGKKRCKNGCQGIKCPVLSYFLKKQCLYLKNIINMRTMADESHPGPHQ